MPEAVRLHYGNTAVRIRKEVPVVPTLVRIANRIQTVSLRSSDYHCHVLRRTLISCS